MEVMNSLGGLILPYCPNDQMKVLGFGAKLKRSKETNFCFPLSRDWSNFAHTGLQVNTVLAIVVVDSLLPLTCASGTNNWVSV